ncbi:MAG: RNase J family beta-CASP ribonuclease, partial [Clostridiales bacterium]|nr:RNase J family beta-CASP ribonuclease [Clostridiales bacterium]
DRRHLGQDGLVIVTAVMDSASGEFISGPEVVSRGFVYVREAEKLINEVKECAADVMDNFGNGGKDVAVIRNKIKDDISRLLYERTKRSPMVLPLIIEI